MKIVIASRIFAPEISAASSMLLSWAEEFRDRGHDVTVLTVRPPKGLTAEEPPGVDVRRAPVHRDRQQYVRGYLSYMSFDLPLAARMLFGPKADLYIIEPPPTTLGVARVIAWLRRTPYVVRAADYWTDAAELVTGNRVVIGLLRWLETWGLNGARMLFAAHEPLLARFREAGVTAPAIPIGFGADTDELRYEGQAPPSPPVFVYAGTYSEWHGATIFIEALARIIDDHPGARLLFYGNGEERESMQARARELGVGDAVEFHAPVPPATLSPILAGATASVASLAPAPANAYALATKVYPALAAGCPVIFAGIGPTLQFLNESVEPRVGVGVGYDIGQVAAELRLAATSPLSPADRAELADWAARTHSLRGIAARVVDESLAIIRK